MSKKNEIIKISLEVEVKEIGIEVEFESSTRKDIDELLSNDEREKINKHLEEITSTINDAIKRDIKKDIREKVEEDVEKIIEEMKEELKDVKDINDLFELLLKSLNK